MAARTKISYNCVKIAASANPGPLPQKRASPSNLQARERALSPSVDLPTPLGLTGGSSQRFTTSPSLCLSPAEATQLAAASSFGFAALTVDQLFWHNLQWLDTSTHQFVTTSVPLQIQHNFARTVLSNGPIIAGWCGWVAAACTLAVLASRLSTAPQLSQHGNGRKVRKAVRHVAFAAAVDAVAGGGMRHGDSWLVNAIKHAVHRPRPSLGHLTFAFPSGHTCACAFIAGTLLFVIAPAMLEAADVGDDAMGVGAAEEWLKERRAGVWAGCVGMTAAGRVLGDMHWGTDVAAGACLGAALVAATALGCSAMDALLDE